MPKKRKVVTQVLAYLYLVIGIVCVAASLTILVTLFPYQFMVYLVATISLFLTFHGIFTLFWMLYAWEDPESAERHTSPKTFAAPKRAFTALIPARHEELVIGDTIRAVNAISYPQKMKEILVLVRNDDTKTIAKVRETLKELKNPSIRLVIFDGFPINKPHGLNVGLKRATHEVVTIFDAEDQPHPDIYNVINSVMERDGADVVQSGVQLMNYRSHWFSTLNVLEYFFWFKSGLHFFNRVGGVTPLGGNTVFFKKAYLEKIGGWDESCLTEDADVGIRLAVAGAKTSIVYDEQHATREETPSSVAEFVRQRTRWNQGFLQIIMKGDWLFLPTARQQLTALYILASPLIQLAMICSIPVGIIVAFTTELPVLLSIASFMPLYILGFQMIVQIFGMYEFTRSYKTSFPIYMPLRILLYFGPYQLLLLGATVRAFYRYLSQANAWEKTLHVNSHRMEGVHA